MLRECLDRCLGVLREDSEEELGVLRGRALRALRELVRHDRST